MRNDDQLSPWPSPSIRGRGLFHLHHSVDGNPRCAATTATQIDPSPLMSIADQATTRRNQQASFFAELTILPIRSYVVVLVAKILSLPQVRVAPRPSASLASVAATLDNGGRLASPGRRRCRGAIRESASEAEARNCRSKAPVLPHGKPIAFVSIRHSWRSSRRGGTAGASPAAATAATAAARPGSPCSHS